MASKKVMVSICGDDRISSLPDGVLCHILSFLPTKYSVRTSLLSTRWKHLFTFVPCLDFKYSALITTPCGSNASNSISFIRFVSSVIMSYNVSCMNKFCFQFFDLEHAPPHFPIFSYISAVIRRHVQEIDISVTSSPRLTLPLDLFSSKTITKLMLQGRFNFVLPCSVSLTCLRTCILLNVRFDDESARRLFRSCPVLINLDLINCFVGDVVALDISVPTLEHLTFYESGEIDRLVLNVPKLLHFDYAGPTSVEFSGLESLKSLVDANIFSEPDSSTRHSNIVDLVRSVSHVQQLYLNCDVMEAFLCSGHSLPTFNNVTHIRFGYISCFSLRFLPALLNSAPRVEFLTLEGSEDEENSTDENGHLSQLHVPACVSRCLKEVDFRFFGGLHYEFKLINYFLKYANNLKVMKMQTEVSWNEKFEISSAACQIVFYSDGL